MSFLLSLLGLVAVVAFGAVVPVVPTGAAVSAAAVLAEDSNPAEILLVIAAGALGAYLGDLTMYAALRVLGEPLAHRMGWLHRDDPEGAVHRMRERIEEHEMRTLLVSRLIPAGRIPVLLMASLTGYPWRRFASAAVASTILWATVYTAVGVVGDTLIPGHQTLTFVVVIAAALLVGVLISGAQRWRAHRAANRAA